MPFRWFRRPTPWQGSHAVDMQHALSVEETLSNVRALLVVVSLAISLSESWRPYWGAASVVLLAMAAYSVAAAVAVRARRISTPRHIAVLHVVDTVGILLALVLTGGALSPFSTLFLFVMLAAGYRWGGSETWLTAGTGMAVLSAHAVFVEVTQWTAPPDFHIVTLRVAYVGIGGLLIGYMAERARRQRYRAWSVARILSRVRGEAGLVAAVHAVLDELLTQFRANQAVLVLEEEGNDRVSVWQADRAASSSQRSTIRLQQQERREAGATYLFPVPAATDAFEVRRAARRSPGEGVPVATMDASGARAAEAFSATPLIATPFPWQAAFCLSSVNGEGWRGRVFLFMPFMPPHAREQLRYLQFVCHQVGPALFNLYLQRRLQSRAGVVERARISRELHDGVIQSLIGVEMQLEVLRRESEPNVPEGVSSQLLGIQRVLSQEILNVRDLMHLLKPAEVDAKQLVEYLADTVERFRHRTGIQARFACAADEIDLSPRVCREVAGIVVEALANVRKHSSASSVLVRLDPCGAHWQLVIDDNGRGLDFEGSLTHEEIEAQRKGPLAIKERVRAVRGRLSIHSQPGFGTRLEITIPRKHHD